MDNINAQVIDADLIHEAILAIKACVVTSELPNVLTKTRKLDPSTGNIITEKHGNYPAGSVIKGYAENITFKSMQEFAAFLDSAKTNQALIAAQHGAELDPVTLLSKAEHIKAGSPSNAITRTKDNFIRRAQDQGLLILDCDDKQITKAAFLAAIREIIPQLDEIAHAYTTSSSSYLYVNGELIQGDKGKRLYIVIKDASDTKRAGNALFDRLWLAGHGKYETGAAGQFLNRGIVDAAMFQDSCRLDFISGSNCKTPVTQQRPPAEYNEGRPLDTRVELPTLNDEEKEELDALQASAKDRLEGESVKKRTAYCERKGREHLAKQGNTTPTPEQLEQAKTNVLKALESSSLTGDFVITLAADNRQVTIAEVLADPDRYDNAATLDPIEPEYHNYSAKGVLYLTDGSPNLYSQAHGGKNYRLYKQSRFIKHSRGSTSETTDETLSLLRLLPNYYDMGEQMVTVKNGHIMPMSEHLLGYELGSVAQYYSEKTDSKGKVFRYDIDPPLQVVRQILSMSAHSGHGNTQRGLKPLKAVITAPTITTDNHIVYKRGYDAKTQLYLASKEELTPPFNPSLAEVKSAHKLILDIVDTFKLKEDLDRSVLYSAFLTAVIRPAVDKSPIYALDAPTKGSGKTYAAECIGTLALGYEPPISPVTRGDDAEIKKTLLPKLMQGEKVIIFDNILGSFNSAALAMFVTSPIYSDRVLGASQTLSLPNKSMVLLTGNNLDLTGDMPRRCITARIDTGEENPLNAQHDLTALGGLKPDEFIRQNRQRVAMACVTIVRYFLNNTTSPRLTRDKVGSFEQWETLTRQPLIYLSQTGIDPKMQDIKQIIDKNMAQDKDNEELSQFIEYLEATFNSSPFTAKDVMNAAFDFSNDPASGLAGDLAEFILYLTPKGRKPNSYTLGKILSNRRDRLVAGRKIVMLSTGGKHAKRYQIVNV